MEGESFGVSHTRAGAIYAEKWNFPKRVVTVIRHHHRVETEINNQLLNIVSVALGVAKNAGIGVEYSTEMENQFDFSLRQLGISRSRALSLLARPGPPVKLACER